MPQADRRKFVSYGSKRRLVRINGRCQFVRVFCFEFARAPSGPPSERAHSGSPPPRRMHTSKTARTRAHGNTYTHERTPHQRTRRRTHARKHARHRIHSMQRCGCRGSVQCAITESSNSVRFLASSQTSQKNVSVHALQSTSNCWK